MKVIVGCEESQVVCKAFRKRGHEAYSCDIHPCSGGHPEWHIQDDLLLHLEDGWDLMIAHPPCTYLSSSGLHWNKRRPERGEQTKDAMIFVFNLVGDGFVYNPIPKIAIENPVGRIGTAYRKADQIIQPYQFGHDASKATCLWLKGLPLLKPTKSVLPHYGCPKCGVRFELELGKYGCPNCHAENGAAKQIWSNQTPSGQNKLGPSATRAQERSKTYLGIGEAMAAQWGSLSF